MTQLWFRVAIWPCLSLCLTGLGCGGGTGLGPEAIRRQEEKAYAQLGLSWVEYNQGRFDAAMESFTTVLSQAERLAGAASIRQTIQAEACNGIGWSSFRLHELDQAREFFQQATSLDRDNADAWVGAAGVALAEHRYANAVQFGLTALHADSQYNSALRQDAVGRSLGHDRLDTRHVRMLLADAYVNLQYYSDAQRADPHNAAAQVRLVRPAYRYADPAQLIRTLSVVVAELHVEGASSP